MTTQRISKIASQLGRLGRGKPKNYTEEELQRRRARLAEARKKRWPDPIPTPEQVATADTPAV